MRSSSLTANWFETTTIVHLLRGIVSDSTGARIIPIERPNTPGAHMNGDVTHRTVRAIRLSPSGHPSKSCAAQLISTPSTDGTIDAPSCCRSGCLRPGW